MLERAMGGFTVMLFKFDSCYRMRKQMTAPRRNQRKLQTSHLPLERKK